MVRLYVAGYKALFIINNLTQKDLRLISDVIIARDPNVSNDYFDELGDVCLKKNIKWHERGRQPLSKAKFSIAIGWRWIIENEQNLIVFHDSLLPRLRGFNPLVTSLINGDRYIGVSAIHATKEYDRGPIYGQLKKEISYPMKIQSAIEIISESFFLLFVSLLEKICSNSLVAIPQAEKDATYSLWRDKYDYFINWEWEASKIKRHIDAVGHPYLGSQTIYRNSILKIFDAEEVNDVEIENRMPGKVIFKTEENITVVCGKGLLRISHFYTEDGKDYRFDNKFRIRFKSP